MTDDKLLIAAGKRRPRAPVLRHHDAQVGIIDILEQLGNERLRAVSDIDGMLLDQTIEPRRIPEERLPALGDVLPPVPPPLVFLAELGVAQGDGIVSEEVGFLLTLQCLDPPPCRFPWCRRRGGATRSPNPMRGASGRSPSRISSSSKATGNPSFPGSAERSRSTGRLNPPPSRGTQAVSRSSFTSLVGAGPKSCLRQNPHRLVVRDRSSAHAGIRSPRPGGSGQQCGEGPCLVDIAIGSQGLEQAFPGLSQLDIDE